jgi:hypothetical protein
METLEFLERALGNTGFYCVFAARIRDGKKVQKFYTSKREIIEAAANFDAEGYDAYFALATFKEPMSRKVDNIDTLHSLYLDLDCGSGKDYPSQAAAISALREFCKATKLPKPMMINSGRGVHVYWMLTTPLTYPEWYKLALKLKQTCVIHNLKADPVVTADGARILRVPSTHNHKADPALPVDFLTDRANSVSVAEFSEFLSTVEAPVFTPRAYVPRETDAVMSALLANRESVFKTIMVKTAEGKGCAQLAYIFQNRAELPEPMWRAGLSIAKHCTDGVKAAHKMSSGHPEYDPAETEAKMDRIKGPYLCTRFEEYNPSGCAGCPHLGKIKSPITLGQHIAEADEEDNQLVVHTPQGEKLHVVPKYPAPYFRGAKGGVYIRATDDEGEIIERCVYHNDLYVTHRLNDPDLGEVVAMKLHLPRDVPREFTVPLTAVTSREDFRKYISQQGITAWGKDLEALMIYTTQWIHELQANKESIVARRQFGWTDDDMTTFILGDTSITATGLEYNPPSSSTAQLFHAFTQRGTLGDWVELMTFYDRPGMEIHQAVILAGFGSILMPFSAVHCLTIHLNGISGLGKTTAMLSAASIWGNPDIYLLQERDTQNTRMNRGEIFQNLPLLIDELTNASPKELSDLLYQMTSGRQRGRLTSGANVERHRGMPWKLLCVTSANASLLEKISTLKATPEAEAMRILEYTVQPHPYISKGETDALAKKIVGIYGHAGPVFTQYVIEHRDEVRALYDKMQKKIDDAASLNAANRFWSAGAAAILTALLVCNKIGLLNYDPKGMFRFLINDLLKSNNSSMTDMETSAQDVLNSYVLEHIDQVLQIKSTEDLRSKHGNGLDTIIVPEARPRMNFVARYETDLQKLFLVPKPLREWCTEQQINYGSFVNELKAKLGAQMAKVRLGKGTHMNLPPANAIVVDFAIKEPVNGSEIT